MSNTKLLPPIEAYFSAKGSEAPGQASALFAEDATVWDNGEDLELRGVANIRDWLSDTSAKYKLSSEVLSWDERNGEFVVRVVVSGDFPGSPYEFAYRFTLAGDKISKLVIDPIGSLAD
jgi:hypothetical protein